MLKDKMYWVYPWDMLEAEYTQCLAEGKKVEDFISRIHELQGMQNGEEKAAASRLLISEMTHSPVKEDWQYKEPDTYSEIKALLPAESSRLGKVGKDYRQRVKGAWYGRAIGCLLGIPVECWMQDRILGFLKESGQFPLTNYIRSDVEEHIKKKYGVEDTDIRTPYDRTKICWINNLNRFPVDDDTNYTVCALKVLERFGKDFTSSDVGETWLYSVAGFSACTAERVAYANMMQGVLPPDSGAICNPYREWIGAQIRADFYGYISPQNPSQAAEMAYRDAAVSHRKNGIYGAMLVAAVISLCFDNKKQMRDIVEEALWQIPPKSRLHEAICWVLSQYEQKEKFEAILEHIHKKYDEAKEFDWCHTISNAMIVVACILYYSRDFSGGIAAAVIAGFDTDCNGATVGSILGTYNGFDAIDPKWYCSLGHELETSISGYHTVTMDDLVERTAAIALD